MPKYFPFKIAGYYLYFTMACIVECIWGSLQRCF